MPIQFLFDFRCTSHQLLLAYFLGLGNPSVLCHESLNIYYCVLYVFKQIVLRTVDCPSLIYAISHRILYLLLLNGVQDMSIIYKCKYYSR